MDRGALKKASPLTYALERLFRGLQFLSPANLLWGTRVESQSQIDNACYQQASCIAVRRSRNIELYIAIWLIVESASIVVAPLLSGWPRLAFIVVVWVRIAEIAQGAINMAVFDSLRRGEKLHHVASLTRVLVLSVWNYLELILCFGMIYAASFSSLCGAKTALDPYYFSVVTQLTVGYGDIRPVSWLKVVVMVQVLLGFLFTLIVLSRLIALMPRFKPLFEGDSA